MQNMFTAAEARNAGIDGHRISSANTCCLIRPAYGVYEVVTECPVPAHSWVRVWIDRPDLIDRRRRLGVDAQFDNNLLRARMIGVLAHMRSRAVGDAVSHRTAALLHGFPRTSTPQCVEVTHVSKAKSLKENEQLRVRRAAAAASPSAEATTSSHGSSTPLVGPVDRIGRPTRRSPVTPPLQLRRHKRPLPADHVEEFVFHHGEHFVRPGFRITTAARTATDIMMSGDPVEALMVADAYLAHDRHHPYAVLSVPTRRTQTAYVIEERRGELLSVFEALPRGPGSARFRQTLAWATGLAGSPLESHAAYVLHVLGIDFEQQVELFDRAGMFIGRTDFFLRDYGLALEVDGRSTYIRTDGTVDPDKVEAEKARNDAFVRAGYRTLRVGWSHVRQPHRLRAALRDMGVVV
ncbi:hypothetical protein [Brevibacterium samyangense]